MMSETKKFTCSICGNTYDDVVKRAHCELSCARRKEIEAQQAEKLKKQTEQNNRKVAVDEAFEKAYELRDEYVKDYGSQSYERKSNVANTIARTPAFDKIFEYFL